MPTQTGRPARCAVAATILTICAAVVVSACGEDAARREHSVPSSNGAAVSRGVNTPTALILDGSDSMRTADAPGPRIDAAKRAATSLIQAFPTSTPLSLLTYGVGTGVSAAEYDAGCRSVSVLARSVTGDRSAVVRLAQSVAPRGFTPIALSLERAVDSLPAVGPASIVVISDGEDTCGRPPCEVAANLKKTRPGLTISTIGLRADQPTLQQMQCIASATGGIAVGADNAQQLQTRLLSVQDPTSASTTLGDNSLYGISIGEQLTNIRRSASGFPAAGRRFGDRTVIVWRDCQWVFDATGSLVEIRVGRTVRTIDGLGVGDPLRRAVQLYGEPADDAPTSGSGPGSGEGRVVVVGAGRNGAGYRLGLSGSDDDATITSIVLCRCGRDTPTSTGVDEVVVRPFTSAGDTTAGWLKNTTEFPGYFACDGAGTPGTTRDEIYWCTGGSGEDQGPCVPVVDRTAALCVRDPFSRVLNLIGVTNPFPSSARASSPRVPYGLVLDNQLRCTVTKTRGVSPPAAPTPTSRPLYRCGDVSSPSTIWAEPGADPIDRSGATWTVTVSDGSGNVDTRTVTTAISVDLE